MNLLLVCAIIFALAGAGYSADFTEKVVAEGEVKEHAQDLAIKLKTPLDIAGAQRLRDYVEKEKPQKLPNGFALYAYGERKMTWAGLAKDGKPLRLYSLLKAELLQAPDKRRMLDPEDPENNFELPVYDVPQTSDLRVSESSSKLLGDGRLQNETLEYSIGPGGRLYNVARKIETVEFGEGSDKQSPATAIPISPEDLYQRWKAALQRFDKLSPDSSI